MANSYATKRKPSKPYPEFPLFAHNNGQWCRKICGRLVSFGSWDDHAAALAKHNAEFALLKEGIVPAEDYEGWRVGELINEFLAFHEARLELGEIEPVTFEGLLYVGKMIAKHIPEGRALHSLKPADFQKLRNAMVKKYSPAVCRVNMTRVRSFFKFAFDQRLIDKPVFYGGGFKSPTKANVRKARNQKPKKLFAPEQVKLLMASASPVLKAMILLSLNTGMNNADLGHIKFRHIDLDAGWIDYPRNKTHVQRRAPLWKKTVKALRDYLKVRQEPLPQFDDFVFITKARHKWAYSSLPAQFRKLVDAVNESNRANVIEAAKKKRKKAPRPSEIPDVISHGSFGYFRHMFETYGGAGRDQVAVDAIMGHVPNGMAGEYRELIDDDRLIDVVNVVHKRLFGTARGGAK